MKKTIFTAIFTIAVVLLISYLFTEKNFKPKPYHVYLDLSGGAGMISFWSGLVCVVVGLLILTLKIKDAGRGLLLAGGILLLIGASLCSGGGIKF